MSGRPKVIYLARRKPTLSRAEFTPRWRQHGALGMSMPRWKNVWQYAHCDVLHDAEGCTGISGDYDGVGMVWYRSAETLAAHRHDKSAQDAMEADELETFAELVARFIALYEEEVVSGEDYRGNVKLMRFAEYKPDPPQGYIHALRTVQMAAVAKLPGVRRYVRNQQVPSEGPQRFSLPYGMVEEIWFDDLPSACAASAALSESSAITNAIEDYVGRSLSIITNQTVLYQLES